MDEQTGKIAEEVAKQITKDAYNDGAKPILAPTGQTLGLVPRAIKAAFLPLEKWILEREYNLEETKKILADKLEKVNPENIQTPEPYIAVPLIQYISYCIDSDELRNMYANLLANSMNKDQKEQVHPGFIEIIKQLSPDEAKILKFIVTTNRNPMIKIRYANEKGESYDIKNKFSDIGEKSVCDFPMNIEKYLDNMERLGLIISTTERYITNDEVYSKLEKHEYINNLRDIPQSLINNGYNKFEIDRGYIELTEFGKSFCENCVI